MKNKGFTLVELVIVIAILAIIMLIGTVSYGTIMKRQRVNADKATGAQIGKSINIAEADGKGQDIPDYPALMKYNSIDSMGDYISCDILPQSAPDGYYFATRIPTQNGKKTVVGIYNGNVDEEIQLDKVYDGDHSGLVYTEGKEISNFIEEVKKEENNTGNNIISGSSAVVPGGNQTPEGEEVQTKLLVVGIDDLMQVTVGTAIGSNVVIYGDETGSWDVTGIEEQTESNFWFTMPENNVQIYRITE